MRYTAYLHDEAAGVILAYSDTDADGIPDTLAATPFASATTHPVVAEVVGMEADAVNSVVVTEVDPARAIRAMDQEFHHLTDNDGDNEADATSTYLRKDVEEIRAAVSGATPRDGDTAVGVFGTPNSTVELWESDIAGALLTLLGSEAIAYGDSRAEFTLSTPLAEGEYLVVIDTDLGFVSKPVEVEPEAAGE